MTKGKNKMGIDQTTLKEMNILANGFANERVDAEIAAIEKAIGDVIDPDKMKLIGETIGKMLAVSYSKGYADCFERIGPRKLIF